MKIIQWDILWKFGSLGKKICLAQQKLDALGYIKAHACFINDMKCLEWLWFRLQLVKSIEVIKEIEEEEQARAREEAERELQPRLCAAIAMYWGREIGKHFTKKHAYSILLLCYGLHLSSSKKKADLIKMIDDEVASNPTKMDAVVVPSLPALEIFPPEGMDCAVLADLPFEGIGEGIEDLGL